MQVSGVVVDSASEVEDSLAELATWGRVRGAMAELAAWGSHVLGTDDPLEALKAIAEGTQCPASVRESVQALRDLCPPLGERAKRYSLLAAFEDLEQTDGRAFEIFRRRKLDPSEAPPTLRALGTELGRSPERIRQMERRVVTWIEGAMEVPSEWPIGAAAIRARNELGLIAESAQLEPLIRRLDPKREALLNQPHRQALILRLAGPYRVDGRWITTDEGVSLTATTLEQATAEGAASFDSVVEALVDGGIRPELCRSWIEQQPGYRVLYGRLTRWSGSLADKAEAVLRIATQPQTPEWLFEQIDEPSKSFHGFKGQLSDARFRRRALNLYGLTEWGGEEYTKLMDEMVEELERQGGSMDLDELAQTLARNFGVAETSVRMYAGGPQFHVDAERRVSCRTGELPIPDTAPLGSLKACFRLHDGWAFRRTIDYDIQRGSGSSLPISFAKEIGLTPGVSRKFDAPFGEISCAWPSHTANIGSLRSSAEALDAREGDHLFVVHLETGRLDVRLVRAKDCDSEDGYRRLAIECGRGISDNPAREVAAALDLDPQDPHLATAIRLRLNERGEHKLAEMVPDQPPDDGLLDVLASLGG